MKEQFLNFTITAKQAGQTIETYLLREVKLTPHQIRTLKFRPQGIRVNGIRQRIHYLLSCNDTLSLQLTDAADTSSHLLPSSGNPTILYEDANLILLSKPAGLVVHPSGGHYTDTLANQLSAYFQKKQETGKIHAIGRLDKDTSGIVLFAKNSIAAARLSAQREKGILKKTYLAAVSGQTLISDTLTTPLRIKPDNPYQMEAHPNGVRAVTHYHRLAAEENSSLIMLQLETGRMHQIRVHMAASGYPLLGDPLYNPNPENTIFSRTALHAWRLTLQHPFTQETFTVSAPFPADFHHYLTVHFPDITEHAISLLNDTTYFKTP
ncbi:MAG: RluA family pseudouridine synthase [Lachnospiraceae bacterium]|jgi:23S rRNA pseudouridine1911/1915/1917 synthase